MEDIFFNDCIKNYGEIDEESLDNEAIKLMLEVNYDFVFSKLDSKEKEFIKELCKTDDFDNIRIAYEIVNNKLNDL